MPTTTLEVGQMVVFRLPRGGVVTALAFNEKGGTVYENPKIMTRGEYAEEHNRKFCDGRATNERLQQMIDDLPLLPRNFAKLCRRV